MCMTCVSQSLPYVALALGGLQVPRLLARRSTASPEPSQQGGPPVTPEAEQHDRDAGQ